MSSLLKNISGLPIGGLSNLGGTTSSDLDFYMTLIYSRTNLMKTIEKFDLKKEYKYKYEVELIKYFSEDISVANNDDLSLSVAVRNKNPKKAADIANYLVDELNKKVVEINTKKTKENRVFIQKRYDEVVVNLRLSEDSLEKFQKKNGVFEAEQQVKASITAFADLEMELARKQVELETAEKMLGENTPSVKNLRDALESLEKKVNSIKSGKTSNSVLIPIGALPTKAIEYYRLYRDVKINSEMLQFLLPLYEQAKFDEQKEIPVILSLDRATPNDKKVYPPRTMYTLLIAAFSVGLVAFGLIFQELVKNSSDPKIRYILRNIFSFKEKTD
jgi:capsule polysaccharide export protein KpsE/RkpR